MKPSCRSTALFWFTIVVIHSAQAALQPVTGRLADRTGRLAANGTSGAPLLAGGDRYVFFLSGARNLVTNAPAREGTHLYRHDRVASETIWVSADAPLAVNPLTSSYSVSADGQRAAFAAHTDHGSIDVFVRDIPQQRTSLVSVSQSGVGGGNGPSLNPSLSADGNHVVFETQATNLVPGMGSGLSFCHRDLSAEETQLIATWDAPWLIEHQTSRDGRIVAYSVYYNSPPEVLPTAPTQLVLWRRETGQSIRVALPLPSPAVTAYSPGPWSFQLSDDGTRIAMYCAPGAGEYREHLTGVWAYNTADASVEKILPTAGNRPVHELSISAEGHRIAFLTNALYSPKGSPFVWQEGTGIHRLADWVEPPFIPPAELSGIHRLRLSPDGTRLIYHTEEAVPEVGVQEPGSLRAYLRVLATGETRLLATDEDNLEPDYSADGQALAFKTSQRFDASDDNADSDVFVLSLATGVRNLVSVRDSRVGSQLGTGDSASLASMSDDGRWVLFESAADDLVPNDHNGQWDLFVHDRHSGSNHLVNLNLQGNSSAAGARAGTLSPDGRYVLFISRSPDLAASDTNRVPDAFVRDLATGQIELITADDTTGHSLEIPALSAVVTGDARKVLVEAQLEPTLGEFGWSLHPPRLFVRDRTTGRTIDPLAGMTNAWGYPLPHLKGTGRIARDGSVVVFNGYDGGAFVRDLRDGSLATLPLPTESKVVDLSPDGRLVLIATPTPTVIQQYSVFDRARNQLRDLPVATPRDIRFDSSGTRLVYLGWIRETWQILILPLTASGLPEVLRVGLNDALANRDCTKPRLSADGRFVLFRSAASNLVEADFNDALDVFLHDRFARQTRLISADATGQSPDGPSFGGMLNAAGTAISLTTAASGLIPGEDAQFTQVLTAEVAPVEAPIDEDGDGLPDRWELDYFGDLTASPSADPDGDQQTTAEEFRARTSPVDALSRVRLESLLGTRGVELSWPGRVGVRYQLQQRISLSQGDWSDLGDVAEGREGPLWRALPGEVSGSFYRVIALP